MRCLTTASLSIASLLCVPGASLAQDVFTSDDIKEKVAAEEEAPESPWSASAKLGLTFVLNDSQNVVGTDDGVTLNFGLIGQAGLKYVEGQHRWSNSLKLTENVQRTPQLGRFVKTFDLLDVESLYVYKLKNPSWLGPFARVALQTAVFAGEAVRAEPVDVAIADAENVVQTGVDRFDLTSAFEPLQLRESVGMFADPYASSEFNLEVQLGVGAQQIIVQDGFVIADETDGVVTLNQLEDVQEFGGELEVSVFGDVVEEVMSYSLKANVYVPAASSAEDEFDLGTSINLKVAGLLSVQVKEWLALEYSLNVIRQPRVLDAFQIQNGLNLALTFDLI